MRDFYNASKPVHFTSNWCPLDQILKPKHKSCVFLSGPGLFKAKSGQSRVFKRIYLGVQLTNITDVPGPTHSSNRLKKNVLTLKKDSCVLSHMGVTSYSLLPLDRDRMRAARLRACLMRSCAVVFFGARLSLGWSWWWWFDECDVGNIVTGSSESFCAKSSAKLMPAGLAP